MDSKNNFLDQSLSTEILTMPLDRILEEIPKKNKLEMKGLIASQINIHNDYFNQNNESEGENTIVQSTIVRSTISENIINLVKEELDKGSVLTNRVIELEKQNNHLIKENENLHSKITELFKMMNELLKIQPKNKYCCKEAGENQNTILDGVCIYCGIKQSSTYDFNSNYEEIKNKITMMFYREIRMKHVLPFSRFVSTYGLTALHSIKNEKDGIKKSDSFHGFLDDK